MELELSEVVCELLSRVSGDRLALVCGARKGKALLGRLLPLCDKDDASGLLAELARNLARIARKDAANEVMQAPCYTIATYFLLDHFQNSKHT